VSWTISKREDCHIHSCIILAVIRRLFSPVRSALSKVGRFSLSHWISLRKVRMIIGSIAYINTHASLALRSVLPVSFSLLSRCDCVFISTALRSFVITRWSKQIRGKRAECKENSCYVTYTQNPMSTNKQSVYSKINLNLAMPQLKTVWWYIVNRGFIYVFSV